MNNEKVAQFIVDLKKQVTLRLAMIDILLDSITSEKSIKAKDGNIIYKPVCDQLRFSKTAYVNLLAQTFSLDPEELKRLMGLRAAKNKISMPGKLYPALNTLCRRKLVAEGHEKAKALLNAK